MSDELAVHHRVPPYVLVAGPESLLAERAVAQTVDIAVQGCQPPY